MLPKREVIQLLSHATVFACPSIYEPLGIVNLEAMACEAAVVASATGGIVEVVRRRRDRVARPAQQAAGLDRPGRSRRLCPRLRCSASTRSSPIPSVAREMGRAGRRRAVEHFAWPAIAAQTVAVYETRRRE